MFRYGDLIIYAALIITALFPFYKHNKPGGSVVQMIYDNKNSFYDAEKDTLIRLKNEKIIIEIKSGMVRIKESDCRDKYCIKQGWLNPGKNGKLICMPNRVIIEFVEPESSEIDAVTE